MKNLVIVGRITKDATLEERSAGKVTNFNVAVNTRKATAEKAENGKRKYKVETEYYRITLWRELAESMVPYLTKGRLISVTSKDFVQEVWIWLPRWQKTRRNWELIFWILIWGRTELMKKK